MGLAWVRAVEQTFVCVEKHVLHGADIGNVRRLKRWSTSPIAVREAAVRRGLTRKNTVISLTALLNEDVRSELVWYETPSPTRATTR